MEPHEERGKCMQIFVSLLAVLMVLGMGMFSPSHACFPGTPGALTPMSTGLLTSGTAINIEFEDGQGATHAWVQTQLSCAGGATIYAFDTSHRFEFDLVPANTTFDPNGDILITFDDGQKSLNVIITRNPTGSYKTTFDASVTFAPDPPYGFCQMPFERSVLTLFFPAVVDPCP